MAKRSAKPILAEILDDRGKITFSSAVDEQAPSITPHLTEPSTQELTETDFQQKLEGIQRQLRGVKLATAQQELETAKVLLQQWSMARLKSILKSAKKPSLPPVKS